MHDRDADGLAPSKYVLVTSGRPSFRSSALFLTVGIVVSAAAGRALAEGKEGEPTGSGMARSAPPSEDTRFSEIGHPGPDPSEQEERPAVSAGVGATHLGNVTYAGARVDVPVSKKFSLIPEFALLHVAPINADDRATVNPYLGAGVGFRPAEGWSLEASGMYGPMAYGLESQGGLLSLSKDFGADDAHDVPAKVTAEVVLAATHFRWANGLGPAGPDVVQGYLEARAPWHATARLSITPDLMLFRYDKSLGSATGASLGTVSTLARVGSYAPDALFGARVGYLIGAWLTPFVEGDEIVYTAHIGDGTELLGGVRVRIAHDAFVMLEGGVLLNRASGPLVPQQYVHDLATVPVIGTEAEWTF